MRAALITLLLAGCCLSTRAQEVRVRGRVMESSFQQGLPGAHVLARSLVDSTLSAGVASGRSGFFELRLGWSGPTVVRISFVGFRAFVDTMSVRAEAGAELDFGVVTLSPEVIDVEGVEISARRDRMTVRGDTVEFFAGGFFVPRYTFAESLVNALPGFEIRDGVVFYMGRPVDRVLVDGRSYFGTDVLEALALLPIEMIDALQVFEQLPENRQFAGVDNGSREQVINLVTDPDKRNALMITAGADGGTSNRYGARSGLTKLNAPIQFRANLSSTNNSNPSEGALQRTHSGGAFYQNTWSENTRLSLDYDVRNGTSKTQTDLTRQFLGGAQSPATYQESRSSDSETLSHTFSGSLRHTIADKHQVSFQPRLLFMDGSQSGVLFGTSRDPLAGTPKTVSTGTGGTSNSLTGGFSSSWEYNDGERTGLMATLNMSFSGDEAQMLQTTGFDPRSSFLSVTDSRDHEDEASLEGGVGFMHRLGENGFFSIEADHARTRREEDRRSLTTDREGIARLDSTLSTDYSGRVRSSGVRSYMGFYEEGGFGLDFSLGLRRESRAWQEAFPTEDALEATNYLIDAALGANRNLGDAGRVRARYAISRSTPSAESLQRKVDNSNPLFLSVGNPDLSASLAHSLDAGVNLRWPESGYSVSANLDLGLIQDVVGTQTWYAGDSDRVLNGILVPAGGQLTRQANLGNQREVSAGGFLSRTLNRWQGGLTLSLSGALEAQPVSINGEVRDSHSRRINMGLSVGGRPVGRLQTRASYALSRSRVDSGRDLQSNDIFSQSVSMGAELTVDGGWNLASEFSLTLFERLGSALDSRTSNWNVSASYRPPRMEQLLLSLAANDLLDSGDTLQQTANSLYLESTRRNRLGRHLLFSVQWQLRSFSPGP